MTSKTQVKKAIIPAAGLGTRFLPATKTVPKEMLTLVDAPVIFYVVEEAVQAGIEDIILIAGRGKHAIEDFFDVSYEVEDKLAKENKLHLLDRLIKLKLRIGTNDLKIAAIVLSLNGTLITRNVKHYENIPNLRIEDWTKP